MKLSCFELWLLLHYSFCDSSLGRHEVFAKLTERLGKTYNKSDASIYAAIHPSIRFAAANAKKLLEDNGGTMENPYPGVALLVLELARHAANETAIRNEVRPLLALAGRTQAELR